MVAPMVPMFRGASADLAGGQSNGIAWGHLTSPDLAHWTEQTVALAPPYPPRPGPIASAVQNIPESAD
eukprot:gene11567-biopygen202